MNIQNPIQQQKMMAIFIFTIALLGLGKGIGNLDSGLNFLTGVMIVGGTLGVLFSIITFFRAK